MALLGTSPPLVLRPFVRHPDMVIMAGYDVACGRCWMESSAFWRKYPVPIGSWFYLEQASLTYLTVFCLYL